MRVDRDARASDIIRGRTGTYSGTLTTMARIYDVGALYLRSHEPKPVEYVVEYGARLWADRHLEALGWAVVGLVGLLPIIWAVFR